MDTVSGLPAANVEATLLKWIPGTWEIIETRYVAIEFDFLQNESHLIQISSFKGV